MLKIPETTVRIPCPIPEPLGFPAFIAVMTRKYYPFPLTTAIYCEDVLKHCFAESLFATINILRTSDGKRFDSIESFYEDKENIKLLEA